MDYPTITAVQTWRIKGPWNTKSGGQLSVLMALGGDDLRRFSSFENQQEVRRCPKVRQGLRIYAQTGIEKGREGGGEFHCLREEIILATGGSFMWKCEDTEGNEREYVMAPGDQGIWIPPGIMHSYVSLENDTSLLVVCNTLFDPDDRITWDTYERDQFGLKEPTLPPPPTL